MNIKKIDTVGKDWTKVVVEFREATVADSIAAEMASGQGTGNKFIAALLAEICTFDGKKMVYEDLLGMPTFFFNRLFSEVTGLREKELQMLLSAFEKENSSAMKKSKK